MSYALNAAPNVIHAEEISSARVELRMDGIVCLRMKDDYLVDVKDTREINDVIGKLSGGKKYPVLTIADSLTNLTSEAVEDALNPNNFKFTSADAFVVKSYHQRLLANFYIKVMKPPVPTKYFDKEADAVEWLRSLK